MDNNMTFLNACRNGQSWNDIQAFPARVAALCLNLCP